MDLYDPQIELFGERDLVGQVNRVDEEWCEGECSWRVMELRCMMKFSQRKRKEREGLG